MIRTDIKPLRRKAESDFQKAVEWKRQKETVSKSKLYIEDSIEVVKINCKHCEISVTELSNEVLLVQCPF